MIEKVSGNVAYAVTSFSRFMGGSSDNHTIPWKYLHYNLGPQGYRTNITEKQLRNAPEFSRRDDYLISGREWELLAEYYAGHLQQLRLPSSCEQLTSGDALIRPLKWLFVGFDGPDREQATAAEQVELGALEQLKGIDLPLRLSAAPDQANASANCSLLLTEIGRDALDDPHTAGLAVNRPTGFAATLSGSPCCRARRRPRLRRTQLPNPGRRNR